MDSVSIRPIYFEFWTIATVTVIWYQITVRWYVGAINSCSPFLTTSSSSSLSNCSDF